MGQYIINLLKTHQFIFFYQLSVKRIERAGDEGRIPEKQRGRRDIRRRRTYERQKGVINHFMRYESNPCKKNGTLWSMITHSVHVDRVL